jgi:YbgC/YbaW family acyl-CoA thioester hydrolase
MPRIKLEMPDKYIFKTNIPVRISDINYGNHLANDALLSIIHEARLQFLNNLGYTELDVAGVGIIMGDVAIVYKNQAYYGDTLTIEIAVDGFSRKSCDFYYRITKKDNKVVALCKTGIVFFDYTQSKPVSIPGGFVDRVAPD